MSSRDKSQTETPGPVPLPPPNRRSSFSQNPSFSTLFGSNRGSPPRTVPDPSSLGRRFSWSYAPPKESSAIDDSDDLATSPTEEAPRSGSEIGRRLSTTATSLREALGFKVEEPTSPKGIKTTPFRKMSEVGSSPGASPSSSTSEGIPLASMQSTDR